MLPQPTSGDKSCCPRLIVDAMLGRLCKWLRLMGYDAEYWREGSDDELIASAAAEGRLIVTRDRELARRRKVDALFIAGETLDEQIAEVKAALSEPDEPLSRCAACNGLLIELPHDAARELVPAYVWHTQPTFRRCSGCARVYWKGTHWPAMQSRISGEGDG